MFGSVREAVDKTKPQASVIYVPPPGAADAIIEAIEADNPGCSVMHTPGLVRITAPGRIVVTQETVEEKLGREWETHEFQMAIVSYFGNIQEWDDDEIVIAWDH